MQINVNGREINGSVIYRADYDKEELRGGDVVGIARFAGGG